VCNSFAAFCILRILLSAGLHRVLHTLHLIQSDHFTATARVVCSNVMGASKCSQVNVLENCAPPTPAAAAARLSAAAEQQTAAQ
jgi:hypothetical protein